ncbi:hypothetical protein BKK51_10815 [Rodentibacter trehalosifermentans]|uniref:Uncharacterized protein n=1 Tax=Rodentibacter trehalosifermentans TaxID=1908263 RepID=A0A1V3INV6_9PAST|nr:hypothetical protein [Rodentibacter trehalosifermentans]OOF43801.1 hypothetical protein BKK51_10815 [Rodentibacter trehalosifermentans]
MTKKQANEQEIQNLLIELQQLLNDVGWTKRELAVKVAQSDHEIDQNSEYERIKKLFNRPPKKGDRLNFYISFIVRHRDNKKENFRKLPKLENFNENQKSILNGIAEIAKEIF